MENILLTTSPNVPINQLEELYSAVKIDEFYLANGTTFISSLDRINNVLSKRRVRSFREYFQPLKLWALLPTQTRDDGSQNFHFKRIFFIAIYTSDSLKHTLQNDFDDVKFGNLANLASEWTAQIFGMFILFSENNSQSDLRQGLMKIYDRLLLINRRMIGTPVAVISTPFNLMLLHNSMSRGVISNIFGDENCLIMIDVKLCSGCEGSPVFLLNNRLVAIVLHVFTWVKGEWTGFSLAVHLHPVIDTWIRSLASEMCDSIIQKKPTLPLVFNNDFPVFFVSTLQQWGSGVLISKQNGIIITCSHVIGFKTGNKVEVIFDGRSHNGKIVYATPEGIPFDLAVIQINPKVVDKVAEFKNPCREMIVGESVYVIGYPLFSAKRHSVKGVSLMHGHVSKVYPNIMAVISCVSNGGVSGGAVVTENAELLGIVSNNLVVGDGDLLIPHVTVVIPSSVFFDTVHRFCATNSLEELACLSTKNETTRDVWQLKYTGRLVLSKL